MMQVQITDQKSPHRGKIAEARVVYYDIYHTGNGPDLCYVKVDDDVSVEMLSSGFEIIEQPEPKDRATGYLNLLGDAVVGGDVLTNGRSTYEVVWDKRLGQWKLDRIDGVYSYPTMAQVSSMWPLLDHQVYTYYAMAMLIKPAYIQLEINEFHLTDTTGQRLNTLSDLTLAIEEGRWPITFQQETTA